MREVNFRDVQEAEDFETELKYAFESVRMMLDGATFDGRVIYSNYDEIIDKCGPRILVAAKRYSEEI